MVAECYCVLPVSGVTGGQLVFKCYSLRELVGVMAIFICVEIHSPYFRMLFSRVTVCEISGVFIPTLPVFQYLSRVTLWYGKFHVLKIAFPVLQIHFVCPRVVFLGKLYVVFNYQCSCVF